MGVGTKTLVEKTKKFFAVRAQIMKSVGKETVPLNVLSIGAGGSLAVIGNNDNTLAFYDFSKSTAPYAEINSEKLTFTKDPGVQPETLAMYLELAIVSLEWWEMAPR